MKFSKNPSSYFALLENVKDEKFANSLFLSRNVRDSKRAALLCSLVEAILLFDDVATLKYLCEKRWLLKIHSSNEGLLTFGFRHWRRETFDIKIKVLDALIKTNCFKVHSWLTQELGIWLWIGQENTLESLEIYGKFLSQNIYN
ncbi:hypothetical protein A9K97_gp465 [Tokyovirus A1]|uniref:hypothetical protein n=1 Tax=Tokyovirus A1 TaxID=1826170 RepID=UPI0007A964D4|nr:hypothetical protein A9K97_gp465 [Tokyovirus A1]BAU79886.1 conserved hypothetical protein [Tokyovirus A1]